MDIGTPGSIFTLQKKKTFYNHLFFFYYHQVWIRKDQSDQSQNGHFFTPMTTEPMLSTEKEGLLHNIVNISFYGKLLFFYHHHIWIRKHPSRIGHRIIGRDNQNSHGIVRTALYFHDTAT